MWRGLRSSEVGWMSRGADESPVRDAVGCAGRPPVYAESIPLIPPQLHTLLHSHRLALHGKPNPSLSPRCRALCLIPHAHPVSDVKTSRNRAFPHSSLRTAHYAGREVSPQGNSSRGFAFRGCGESSLVCRAGVGCLPHLSCGVPHIARRALLTLLLLTYVIAM